MANPRKFSEKIALHNQKQAEETAAFEAIMRDVKATTQVGVPKQQPVHMQPHPQQQPLMHLTQPQLGVYRGGSLPDVNNQSIDLRGALEDMKQISGRESLIDRYHRQRQMPSPHRRPFPFDKRTESSPYNAPYLSPPADTSWRRTSSDSAIHTSSMGQQNMGNNRRENSVPQESVNMYELQQQGQRPKSCEVPGINIYPSPEQGTSIPISTNTGSLPDLTNIHFPSPLTTPLDAPGVDEAQQHAQVLNHHGNHHHGNLSPTAPHHPGHHIGAMRQGSASPGARRRHAGMANAAGPQPLVLHNSPTQMRHTMSPQLHDMDSRLHGGGASPGLHAPPQYHPYHSSPSPQRRSTAHSPHRQSPVHSPHRHSPGQSPHRQPNMNSNTLTVPCALPVPLQNYIANHNPQTVQQQHNHLLSSMDSLSVNSDAILGSSPGSSGQHLNSHLGQTNIGHNGPVSPQAHVSSLSNSQMQQPKIVISSDSSSNRSILDINGHHTENSLTSQPASNRKCSIDADESQGSPLGYRSSQSDCPASPNSPVSPHSFSPAQSPGLPPTSAAAASPGGVSVGNGGRGVPCSAPGGGVFTDNYYMHQQAQTNALQHQFEQFNMHLKFFPTVDNPDLNTAVTMYQNMANHQQQYSQANMNNMNSALSGSSGYMSGGGGNAQQQQNHFYKQTSHNGSPHGPAVAAQHPSSPHQPSSPVNAHQSPHQPASPVQPIGGAPPGSPQSPQNQANNMAPSPTQLTPQEQLYHNLSPPQMSPQPNSIPDIILTDEAQGWYFSSAGADDKQDFSKDLGSAMQNVQDMSHDLFGDTDLLQSNEAIKDGLDPLNFNDLQMLSDPSIVTDPATEDSFRLDRL